MNLSDHRSIIGVTSELKFLEQWLAIFLIKHGYRVQSVNRNPSRVAPNHLAACELVIVETSRNIQQSLTLTKYIRSKSNAAILLLSHSRRTLGTIEGLEAGADDVVQTPYELSELLIRINFLIKAQRRRAQFQSDTVHEQVAHNELVGKAYCHKNAKLTDRDRKLLNIMLDQPFTPIGRDQLKTILSENGQVINSLKSIDAAISKLRKKFKSEKATIKAERGLGYVLLTKRHTNISTKLQAGIQGGTNEKSTRSRSIENKNCSQKDCTKKFVV